MVSARSIVFMLVLLLLGYAHAGKREAEAKLRWWLQQPESRGGFFAQGRLDGVDYRKLLRGAVAYDRQSLAGIFRYTVNGQLMGEGADTNCEILHLLLEHWGDSRFASVLAQQPQRARKKIIAEIEYDWSYPGWKPTEFPNTNRLAPHEKIPTSSP
jgi:hypothetical protein